MGFLFLFQLERWLFDWTTFETKFEDCHTFIAKKIFLWHRILKVLIEILAGIPHCSYHGSSEIHCSQMKIPDELTLKFD